MLNSGEPLYENKKTYEGTRKRIQLLSQYYEKTESIIAFASKDPHAGGYNKWGNFLALERLFAYNGISI